MRQITLNDFLTDAEIQLCVKTAGTIEPSSHEFVSWVEEKVIQPNIKRINNSLGQENDSRFLAYAVSYVLTVARRQRID